MILPNFIEGVGNEVVICALSLGVVLICVGLRLYYHGIHVHPRTSNTQNQSMNSNSDEVGSAEQVDSIESTTVYNTGVLDADYMESLRNANYHLDTGRLVAISRVPTCPGVSSYLLVIFRLIGERRWKSICEND